VESECGKKSGGHAGFSLNLGTSIGARSKKNICRNEGLQAVRIEPHIGDSKLTGGSSDRIWACREQTRSAIPASYEGTENPKEG
jgi:hypothetical protein